MINGSYTMKDNPFNLTFGKEPTKMISRFAQTNEILDIFSSDRPSQQVYMITGVRGSGKTVFMNSIAKSLSREDDWIVLELNSSADLLHELAAKLYNTKGMTGKFKTAGINLSFWGIDLSIKKAESLTDLGTAIELMLEHVSRSGKKVLITIDEVLNSKDMRVFAGAFQIFIRHDYPLFLLMTGLYENINKLQNEENLTFLYRAPKVYLSSLNISRITDIYENTLKLKKDEARKLALISKGYSFAFQVIGYFTYSHNGDYNAALPDIRQYIDEYVYDKIWIELSEKETVFLEEIAVNEITDVKSLKESLALKPNEFSVYRDRLIKKGILESPRRGYLEFALPYLDDYIRERSI